MTVQTLEAVYENGSFRPLKPLDVSLQEGQQVRLVIEAPGSPEDILDMMLHFYDGVRLPQNLSDGQKQRCAKIVL